MKLYYAFKYADSTNTTYADNPRKVCGDVLAFLTKLDRDQRVVNKFHRGCTMAVTRKQLEAMGYKNLVRGIGDHGSIQKEMLIEQALKDSKHFKGNPL